LAIELEHRFGKDSRVRDYWLAASEGFAVQSPDGRTLGTVRQVVRERDGKAVVLLVESRGKLGRVEEMVLEAEAIEEVAPWRSALVVPAIEAPERAPRAFLRRLRALESAGAGAAEAVRARSGAGVAAARGRWPEARGAVTAALSEASRVVVAADARIAEAVRTHWPAAQALIRYAWSWIVAVVVGLAALLAELSARLVRGVVERVAAARSSSRP
jgi:hypothetical protein